MCLVDICVVIFFYYPAVTSTVLLQTDMITVIKERSWIKKSSGQSIHTRAVKVRTISPGNPYFI